MSQFIIAHVPVSFRSLFILVSANQTRRHLFRHVYNLIFFTKREPIATKQNHDLSEFKQYS